MRTAHKWHKSLTCVSVLLPERFGLPPCTFGTQLNVFSRESSANQSCNRISDGFIGFLFVFSIHHFSRKSTTCALVDFIKS